MAELDVAPAASADQDDAQRNVLEPSPPSSRSCGEEDPSEERSSGEKATLRPPASAALLLSDEAPDTVRRRIEPGPNAVGGARRESGVQPVTPELLETAPEAALDGPAPADSASADRASADSLFDASASAVHSDIVLAGGQVRLPSQGSGPAQVLDEGVLEVAGEATVPSLDVAVSPPHVESAELVAESAADAAALAAESPSAEPAGAGSPVDDGDFAQEVPAGWIEEGADDAPSLDARSAENEEAGDPSEEVQASWIEQGGELEARTVFESSAVFGSSAAFDGSAASRADPDEVTAGWIEQGERRDRVAPSVPIPPGRREPSQPWIDEEVDPVTPHDRGRAVPAQTADLPLAEDLRGRVLANRFLAEEILEQSAASITYSAYHLALDSPVMIQVLPRGLACFGEACELVRQTAVTASMIGSAHIARMLDFGVFGGGWPYWVAEHVEGKSLARLVGEESKLGLRRVLAFAKQVAAGLAAAHAAGIVHGHIKPDCLFVVEPGTRTEAVRIIGFGLLHAAGGQSAPPSSGVFGVPFYVSPEQAACRPCDERTDLYALGAVLYELMTGRPPFTGGDFAAVLCQHLDDDAEPPSVQLDLTTGIARGLDEVVLRCLAKDPEQRYASAAELADALVALEQSVGTGKRRPMPEVARPTATIHSPAPRVDNSVPAGPKVIVSADLEAEALTPPAAAAVEPGADDTAAASEAVVPPAAEELGVAARNSEPPEPAGDGSASRWWGRLLGRVSGNVRRPS